MITTGNFAATFSLLEPGLRKIFESDSKAIPRIGERVVYVGSADKKTVSYRTFGGFGAAVQVNEAASVTYDDPSEGYLKQLTAVKYGLGFQVTEEMLDDDQYGVIKARPGKLARALNRNLETVLANLFNNGFTLTTGTLTADGLPLFYSAHTLLGGGTYGNRPSTDIDLSQSALEAALTSMALIQDDRGGITPYMGPYTLMVHPNEQWNAERLLKTKQEPGSANNDINPIANQNISLVVNPYLSDSDAWFLLCSVSEREMGPMLLWRKKPDFVRDTNTDTRVAKFNSMQRYAVGAVDWRGTYGSSGS